MAEFTTGTELINPMTIFEVAGIREGMHVVDLGCGSTGHFVLPAARLVGKDGVVYAVDIQKSVLSAVQGRIGLARLQNVKLVWGDIERPRGVGIQDNSVDIVLLINNLFLVDNRVPMGKEAFRILKQGGTFVVIDWKPTSAPFGPSPKTRVSKEVALQAMEQAGFHLIREFEPGTYHYGFLFEKK